MLCWPMYLLFISNLLMEKVHRTGYSFIYRLLVVIAEGACILYKGVKESL